MTATERIRTTRNVLSASAIVGAVAWATAVALLILAVLSFGAVIAGSEDLDARWHSPAALVAGTIAFAILAWRARHLVSSARVALWIEEKIPVLHYSLVTAHENRSGPNTREIESSVAREDIGGVVRRAAGRNVFPALAAAALALALLYISPSTALGGGAVFRKLAGRSAGLPTTMGNRLDRLTVHVTPPSYAESRTVTLDDPASITALAGSRIVVRGEGEPSGIIARAGTVALPVQGSRGGWSTTLSIPAKPAALTLRDRGYERIIILDPRADNPPRITLTSPERDSTLRAPQLLLRLAATASDDIGLQGAYFEYLVTSGSGEIFSARTMTTPLQSFGGARRGSIAAALDLATLGLKQGDVVSIRAITQDRNSLSGPGIATSDTRTYRIARADEYDSVAIDAAGPLPIDSSAMSQRMLIMMTEQLVREQKGLTRQQLVKRSTDIGDLEDRIRKRVHEILYEQEAGAEEEEPQPGAPAEADPHDHSDEPVPAHNKDLLEAYNALWEAVRSLQIAEPAPALPPMRVALKALDRARLANRLYLRGLPPKVIVDLARVRMTGKEKGSGSIRTPVSAADSARVLLERRFGQAIELLEPNATRAIRELTLLQVDALSVSPAFAAAVGEAVEAFRRGRDATLPLLRARRALSGAPAASPGLPSWSGGP